MFVTGSSSCIRATTPRLHTLLWQQGWLLGSQRIRGYTQLYISSNQTSYNPWLRETVWWGHYMGYLCRQTRYCFIVRKTILKDRLWKIQKSRYSEKLNGTHDPISKIISSCFLTHLSFVDVFPSGCEVAVMELVLLQKYTIVILCTNLPLWHWWQNYSPPGYQPSPAQCTWHYGHQGSAVLLGPCCRSLDVVYRYCLSPLEGATWQLHLRILCKGSYLSDTEGRDQFCLWVQKISLTAIFKERVVICFYSRRIIKS